MSAEELEAALAKAAIAVRHDARLLPIYQRVERELAAAREREAALGRALAMAGGR